MARLNGWKDIAAHMGKSVRTVQRWERDYQLPVHRLGREGGEIIWAEPDELDGWLRTHGATRIASHGDDAPAGDPAHAAPEAPPPPAAPSPAPAVGSRRGITPLVIASLLVGLVATASVAWMLTRPAAPDLVAGRRVVGSRLEILDTSDRVLWQKQFSGLLRPAHYAGYFQQEPGGAIALADIDDNGTTEVVFLRKPDDGAGGALHVFESDGRERFEVAPTDSVTFGETTYTGPWTPNRLWLRTTASGEPRIYTGFIHRNFYPTLLLAFDADGNERGRYWSNGYIEDVSHAKRGADEVVLVGATNNDTKGGSLAVFPLDGLAGAPPAIDPKYRCRSCGERVPDEFLIFPRRCLAVALAGTSSVSEASFDDGGDLRVHVTEGNRNTDGKLPSGVWYTFNRDLQVTEALLSSGLVLEHRAAHQSGLIDHPLGDGDRAEAFPVLRWIGDRFIKLNTAPVLTHGQ